MSSFRKWAEYAILNLIVSGLNFLPLDTARELADGLAFFVCSVLKIRKTVTLNNLSRAFPQRTDKERRRIYRRVWRHFTRVAVELARLPRLNSANMSKYIYIAPEQATVLTEALSLKRGVIFVSGHLGNWEWLGAGAAMSGFPMTYVVENQTNRRIEEWMNRLRTKPNVEIVTRQNAVKGILSALKRNRIVAMLSDQDAGPAGVFVLLFGTPASTPRGPALFHLKTGAPIVFGAAPFIENKYRIIFERLTFPNLTGDYEIDEASIMSIITKRLEREITNYPEQYLWLHRRWKTTPKA